jgi:hypothetical protein
MFRFFFLFFFLSALSVAAVGQEGWSGGITLQPFHYWLYNETDYAPNKVKTEPQVRYAVFVVDDQHIFKPTGLGVGGVLRYGFSERWSVRAEMSWSIQEQRYFTRYPAPSSSTHTLRTRLQYLRLPLLFEWNSAWWGRSRLYGGAGIQGSWLLHYREQHVLINNDHSQPYISWGTTVNSTSTLLVKNYAQTETLRDERLEGSDWLYRRLQGGGVVRVGVSREIGDRWILDLGLRGEYDFSNADNLDATYTSGDGKTYSSWETGLRGGVFSANYTVQNRTSSHNIRAGLECTIRMIFDR